MINFEILLISYSLHKLNYFNYLIHGKNGFNNSEFLQYRLSTMVDAKVTCIEKSNQFRLLSRKRLSYRI